MRRPAATGNADDGRRAITLDEIPDWASEHGNVDNGRSIRAVEIRVPRQLLSSGLALIDTPGVGGLHSVHGAATMAVLGTAQVVIFVSDASPGAVGGGDRGAAPRRDPVPDGGRAW